MAMATDAALSRPRISFIKWSGIVCMWAGILGAVSGIYLAVVPPDVALSRFSYPLDASQFALIQVWFGVQHVGLMLGLVGLGLSGAAGTGRTGRFGLISAIGGMAVLTMTEFAAILAASASTGATVVTRLEIGYGVSTTLVGVGLVIVGISVLRAAVWRGWRRFLPLTLGIYVFVPMTPALSGPFVAARLAITGWMLLFGLLGWALIHSEDLP
jgi:hypothetical protein